MRPRSTTLTGISGSRTTLSASRISASRRSFSVRSSAVVGAVSLMPTKVADPRRGAGRGDCAGRSRPALAPDVGSRRSRRAALLGLAGQRATLRTEDAPDRVLGLAHVGGELVADGHDPLLERVHPLGVAILAVRDRLLVRVLGAAHPLVDPLLERGAPRLDGVAHLRDLLELTAVQP